MGFMGVFQERSSEMNSEEIFDIKTIIQIPNEDRFQPDAEKYEFFKRMLLGMLGFLLGLFAMYILEKVFRILKHRRNQRNPPEDTDHRNADDIINHDNGTIQNLPPPTYDTLSPPPPTYQEAIFGRRRSLFVPKPRK